MRKRNVQGWKITNRKSYITKEKMHFKKGEAVLPKMFENMKQCCLTTYYQDQKETIFVIFISYQGATF